MPNAAPEINVEEKPAKLICEACGAEFSCGARLGECWCFAVETTPENLSEWREKYQNCLCETCLSETKLIDARR